MTGAPEDGAITMGGWASFGTGVGGVLPLMSPEGAPFDIVMEALMLRPLSRNEAQSTTVKSFNSEFFAEFLWCMHPGGVD